MTEVIRPGAYRLKDDNGNVLTNTRNIKQLRRFVLLKLGLTIFFIQRSLLQAPQPEYSRPRPLGGSTRVRYHLSFLLLYSKYFLPK